MKQRLAEVADRYMRIVKQFADRVLTEGRDRYGLERTSLLVDGIHVGSREPVVWRSAGQTWVLSNLANQQNLLRTLSGLSELTGVPAYKEAACEVLDYAFRHLRYGGLFCWGGHMAFDLQTKQMVYSSDKGPQHELKCHYPYYELMAEVDKRETIRYVEAFWESHVTDWQSLEFSRHGRPSAQPSPAGELWDRPTAVNVPVFFTGKGLTFINAGSDLYYAAGMLGALDGDERPLTWAKRLAQRYGETRNSVTGLGGYQFSISVLPGQRGDRAVEQFGEQLREHQPIEATLSVARQIHTIIGESALCRMALAERLGAKGAAFRSLAAEDLSAYGAYAYDKESNRIHPILTNGTRLTGLIPEKDGYYGKKGQPLAAAPADLLLLWSYVTGYRLTGDRDLWEFARSIARGNGFDEIGEAGGSGPRLNGPSPCTSPVGIFAFLDLYRATRQDAYLEQAVDIAEAMVQQCWHHGYFLPSKQHDYAKFDHIGPLALLHLAGEIRGIREQLPVYFGGTPFFSAAYDGHGHMTDNRFLYQLSASY